MAGNGVHTSMAGGGAGDKWPLGWASQVWEWPATSAESQTGKGGRYRRQPIKEEWEGQVEKGYPIMGMRGVVSQGTLLKQFLRAQAGHPGG